MEEARFIHALVFILHLHQSRCDVHSLIYYAVGSEGLSLPSYTERVTLDDDVTVFYYDSTMKSTPPCPEWLDTAAGKQLWKESSFSSYTNRATMALSLETATSQFNNTKSLAGINVYQCYSRCDLYPNGTVGAMLSHAFNGKDFVSLDIDNERFIASVPQALMYKSIRENHKIIFEAVVSFHKTTCFERLGTYLQHSPGATRKNAPEVRLFERQRGGTALLTCHVTGFYPRAVQVEWMGAGLRSVDDEMNEVLPNGDGTYQSRRSVIRPEEKTGGRRYSCVVHHSSLQGNITATWDKGVKPFRLPVWIILGFISMVAVVGLVIRCLSLSQQSKL